MLTRNWLTFKHQNLQAYLQLRKWNNITMLHINSICIKSHILKEKMKKGSFTLFVSCILIVMELYLISIIATVRYSLAMTWKIID